MGNQQATMTDIGWLAGIIDGEGHLGLSYQNKNRCTTIKFDLSVVNTDFAITDKVVRILRDLGVNPYVRDRVHIKSQWATNRIVTVGKMIHIERVLFAVLPSLTGIKHEKANLMLALIESRKNKQRRPYDAHENAIVEKFRGIYVGKCGASTTAREALAKAKRRYSLDTHESA